LISHGIVRKTAPTAPLLIEKVAAEAAKFYQTEGEVQRRFLFEAAFLGASVKRYKQETWYPPQSEVACQEAEAARARATRGALFVVIGGRYHHLDHLLSNSLRRNSSHRSPSCYKTVRAGLLHGGLSKRNLYQTTAPQRDQPCSIAFFFNSKAEAPTRINSRSSSI